MAKPAAFVLTCLAALFGAVASAGPAAAACQSVTFRGAPIVYCVFKPSTDDIRLYLDDAEGAPLGHFGALRTHAAAAGEKIVFAMNAGMYHRDRSPVGHYMEAGAARKKVNTNPGPGNFHMLPNGVVWIAEAPDGTRSGHVATSEAYLADARHVRDASQSGPMLVIDGALHPRFLPDSDSKKRRNGVGVRDDGALVFAISDAPINFYDFAVFFRDEMKTANALYLDGTISRLHAEELGRSDPGLAMGPIIAVTAPRD